MDEPSTDNVTPFPWRERADLHASIHAPILGAFDRTMRQIGALTVLVLDSTLETEDKNEAMEYLATAATRTLQANIVYVERSVLPDIGER